MSNNFPITTKRLFLRPILLEDSSSIFDYRSDSLTNQYQVWIPKTINDVHDFITNRTSPEINLPGSWFQLVIIKKQTNELIGDIGVHFLDLEVNQMELGIILSPNHQGNGFATEALTGVVNYLFNQMRKHRITASIDPRNLKSIQLFERPGFRKEAHFKQSIFIKDEWVDDLIYAILKDEWDTGD